MRDIAVPTWVFGGHFEDLLAGFSLLGLRLLEITASSDEPGIDLRQPELVERVRRGVEQHGQQVYSLHSGFHPGWDVAALDESERAGALANHAAVLRAAQVLGARHVVIHPGLQVPEGVTVEAYLDRALEGLAELVPVAREAGVLLAAENLPPGYAASSPAQMRRLLDALDPAVVGYCCDTGHAQLAGEGPVPYLRACGDRLIGIHWQDTRGTEDDHLFPGTGIIDWEAFFAALRELGWDQVITVEAYPPRNIPLPQAVAIARAAVRDLQPPVLPDLRLDEEP